MAHHRSLGIAFTLLLVLAGCATTGHATGPRPGDRSQAGCLADAPPGSLATGPRPLFFLLCIQAP